MATTIKKAPFVISASVDILDNNTGSVTAEAFLGKSTNSSMSPVVYIDTFSAGREQFYLPVDSKVSISFNVNPEYGYYYQIKGVDYGGGSSFKGEQFYCVPIPTTPTLTSPESGLSNQDIELTLEWTNGTGADTVSLEIGTDIDNLSRIIDNVAVYSPSKYVFLAKPGVTYYWRIINHNYGGDSNSQTWYFSTKTETPIEITDFDYTAGELTWTAPVPAPDGYDIYISPDLYTVINADRQDDSYKGNEDISGTPAYTLLYPTPDTLYYYRIDTFNETDVDGNVSITKGKVGNFYTGSTGLSTAISTVNKEKIIAISDGSLFYGTEADGFTEIDLGLDTDLNIDVLCAFNKCFVVNGTTKKVVDFTNTKITVSALAKIPPRDTLLYQGTSNLYRMVIDHIDVDNLAIYAQIINGSIDATADIYWMDSEGNKVVLEIASVASAPQAYDWDVYPETITGSGENGEMPSYIDMIAIFQGSIVVGSTKSNIYYISAPNNPFKFAFYEVSSGFAAATGYTGRLGQNITAIMPYNDDYLIIAGRTQMWLFRGSPADGVTPDDLSNTIGVYNNNCWCEDGSKRLFLLNENGIYMFSGALENVTETIFPRFANEFTVANSEYLSVVYDKLNDGILVSNANTASHKSLFLSFGTGGTFEQEFGDIGGVCSGVFDEEQLLLGCFDGSIKYYDTTKSSDEYNSIEVAINSSIFMAPIRIIGDTSRTAILNTIETVFDIEQGSDRLDIEIYTGTTATEVLENYASGSYRWSSSIKDGHSYRKRPRIRANYIGIHISNDDKDVSWAMERIKAEIQQKGKVRL